MPAVPLHRAIATKSSISALFAMAEAEGFVSVWVATEHAAKLLRNKCYAWRSRIRKQGLALTSVETSPYDGYSFPIEYDEPAGRWKFTITSDEMVEFEIIIPDDADESVIKNLPFDWVTDSDLPQVQLDEAEGAFHSRVNDFVDDPEIPF